jgi:hypothetical protein
MATLLDQRDAGNPVQRTRWSFVAACALLEGRTQLILL